MIVLMAACRVGKETLPWVVELVRAILARLGSGGLALLRNLLMISVLL